MSGSVTITAITSRTVIPSVADCLSQPLLFKRAKDPEDHILTVPPKSFVILSSEKDAMTNRNDLKRKKSEQNNINGLAHGNPSKRKKDESNDELGEKFEEVHPPLFPRHQLPVRWTQKYVNPPGLINNGVTCYMNSVLQVLLHVPAMVEYLLRMHKNDCTKNESCVMCAFQKLTEECYSDGRKARGPIYPRIILKKMRANGSKLSEHRQEDAHEFLRQFIDALQLSVAPKHLKEPVKETSVIHRIFGGRFRQQIRCKSCNYPSNTYQPALDIPLDIRRNGTVQTALKRFFASEELSKVRGNAYKCERCKTFVDAEKRTLIYDAPEYLTLHLKRFDFTFRGTSKIQGKIQYPKNLELSSYSTKKEVLSYELIGVIVHQGRRASSGHYISFVKQSNGLWACYNDEIVDSVSEKRVLDQEAYILVYARDQDDIRHPSVTETASETTNHKPERFSDDLQSPNHGRKEVSSNITLKKKSESPVFKTGIKLFDDEIGEVVSRETLETVIDSTQDISENGIEKIVSNEDDDDDDDSDYDEEDSDSETDNEKQSILHKRRNPIRRRRRATIDPDLKRRMLKKRQLIKVSNAVAAVTSGPTSPLSKKKIRTLKHSHKTGSGIFSSKDKKDTEGSPSKHRMSVSTGSYGQVGPRMKSHHQMKGRGI
ncbi:hypothetical protein V1511DRAFT_152951 [Dipodascopsis uninucleata]